jgi:hypothetical protein
VVPIAIFVGVVAAVAVVLLIAAGTIARVSKRRRTGRAFGTLSSLRSPSGRPFFPETAEEKRREQRLLSGWDPTYGDSGGPDPNRW